MREHTHSLTIVFRTKKWNTFLPKWSTFEEPAMVAPVLNVVGFSKRRDGFGELRRRVKAISSLSKMMRWRERYELLSRDRGIPEAGTAEDMPSKVP